MSTQTRDPMAADKMVGRLKQVEDSWLKAHISDSTLHPVVWLSLGGLLLLAWLIQPGPADSPAAISLLLFLRFVLIFILAGSLWGRVGMGALVGIALFFTLMGAESLSVLMWDVRLSRYSTELIRHADWIAHILYVVALIGLVACGVMTLALRREKLALPRRHVRHALQILATIQIMLVIELAYTGLWTIIQTDSHHGMDVKTVMSSIRGHVPK